MNEVLMMFLVLVGTIALGVPKAAVELAYLPK